MPGLWKRATSAGGTARGALGALWTGLMALLGFVIPSRSGWWSRQASGTWRRTKALADWVTFDRFMPSGVADTIQEIITLVPKAFGVRDARPREQLSAAVILGFFAYGFAFLTLGLTLGVALALTLMAFIALARLVPAFNDGWKGFTDRLPVENDYDIVGWSRE